ncbi:MAG: glycoside hydrolase family 20 zincin-like fold domain-containing protein [Verrucomicrobiae bacterium]|nr:glycoside hydrolase family 20 zincin-like fold domain-containing protein [Verrucomicrobiae bacterium]
MKTPFILLAVTSFFLGVSRSSQAQENIIIPTPKEMRLQDVQLALDQACLVICDPHELVQMGGKIINTRLNQLGLPALPVHSAQDPKRSPNIVVGTISSLAAEYQKSMPSTDWNKIGPQGYIISRKTTDNMDLILLAGKDPEGTLYACQTFSNLMEGKNGKCSVPAVEIADWPDYRHRSARIIVGQDMNEEAGQREAKSLIDWCLAHKFNYIYFNHARKANDDAALKVNRYANDRGITLTRVFDCNVGAKGDPSAEEYAGLTENLGRFFTWGRDDLIEKRCVQIAGQINRQGWRHIIFHPIDVPSDFWDKRDEATRKKFGDDRAAATAHRINTFNDSLHKKVKHKLNITWVIQPYNINLNLPGNQTYREMAERICGLIPPDVPLVSTIPSTEGVRSWKKLGRPLYLWRNDPYASELGIYFSSILPFMAKSAHDSDNSDIFASLSHPLSSAHTGKYAFNWYPGEPMTLMAAEYSWNASSLNDSFFIRESPGKPSQDKQPDSYGVCRLPFHFNNEDYGTWVWFKSSKNPESVAKNFLLKACVHVYGKKGGEIMAEILNAGILPKVILDEMPVWYEKIYPAVVEKWRSPDFLDSQLQSLKDGIEKLERHKSLNGGFAANTGCGRDFCAPFIDQLKTIKIAGEARRLEWLASDAENQHDRQKALTGIKALRNELSAITTDYSHWKAMEKLEAKEKTIMALANPGKDLVAWWQACNADGNTLKDCSGKENHLNLFNAKIFTFKNNKSLAFNGADSFAETAGPAPLLPLNKSFSTSAWVRLNAVKPSTILAFKVSNAPVFSISVSSLNSFVASLNGGGSKTFCYGWKAEADTWYHLAITRDVEEGTLKLYLNGRCIRSVNGASKNLENCSKISLGGVSPAPGAARLDGYLADVRIFERALSAGEIAAHYGKTKAGY